MKRMFKVIEAISEWTGRIPSFFIYIGTAVLVYEVVARYVFNAPTIWAHGLSQRIFAVYFVIGGAYVLLHKGHINVDIIYNRFSPRTKAIIDLITLPLPLVIIIVLLRYGSNFALTSLTALEECGTPMHAPIYPVKIFIPVAAFLLLLQVIVKSCRDLITAITGRECEY